MAKNKVFIVASDGQHPVTALSAGILARARQMALSTVAIKPVATGCRDTEQGLRSDQALALIEQMTLTLPYAQVNPVALASPREPMLAAAAEGRLDRRLRRRKARCRALQMHSPPVRAFAVELKRKTVLLAAA